MTDHLPECPAYDPVGGTDAAPCWCPALRACEQRVTERHNAEHEDDRLTAFQNGYAAALDAARDAVAAAHECDYGFGYACRCTASALAAIDALRPAPEAMPLVARIKATLPHSWVGKHSPVCPYREEYPQLPESRCTCGTAPEATTEPLDEGGK